MISVPFKIVLWSAARKLGIGPETDGIDKAIAAQLVDGMNTAMKLAWEYHDWPQLMTTASYTVTAHPDSGGSRYLANVTGTGQDRFGTVFNIFDGDPRKANAKRLKFLLLEDGYYLNQNAPATVWVQHRRPCPTFTDAVYEARVYAVDEVVYVPGDGLVYRCTALVTSGNTPAPGPSVAGWTTEYFPKFLAEAVKFGAVASMNRSEGQAGTASGIEAIMVEFLDHEIDQIATQQRQQKYYQS